MQFLVESKTEKVEIMERRIGFIGAGNMGKALISSLVKDGYGNIMVSDMNQDALDMIEEEYKIRTTQDNIYLAKEVDIVVVSVKPNNVSEVLESIKDYANEKLVISIAAGKTIFYLSKYIGHERVVRVMPFMGSMYGRGATAYTLGKGCMKKDKKDVVEMFGKSGIVFEVEEEQMHAVTCLASTPGLIAMYLHTIIEELKGHEIHEQVARDYLANVCYTMGDMIKTGELPLEIHKKVASPGGTTEAAHKYGEEHHFYDVLKGMINAAVERSKELGRK
jgi:pyrroline-5-carboxylate reductase